MKRRRLLRSTRRQFFSKSYEYSKGELAALLGEMQAACLSERMSEANGVF